MAETDRPRANGHASARKHGSLGSQNEDLPLSLREPLDRDPKRTSDAGPVLGLLRRHNPRERTDAPTDAIAPQLIGKATLRHRVQPGQ